MPKLVFVDDLPHAGSPEQRARLAEALTQLAAGARNPVVVTLTDAPFSGGPSGGAHAGGGAYGRARSGSGTGASSSGSDWQKVVPVVTQELAADSQADILHCTVSQALRRCPVIPV